MYKTLFVDFDDTLWDSYANSRKAMESLFGDSILASVYASFDDFFGEYMPLYLHLWEEYHHSRITKEELTLARFLTPLQSKGIDNAQLALALNNDYLSRVAEQTTLVPFARELMEHLSSRYHTVMLSNGFKEIQYTKLSRSGLEPFFNEVVLSEDVGANKPDPAIFRYALSQSGTLKEEALMIGDNFDADITGARNAGIDQLFFNLSGRTIYPFRPTYVISRLEETLEIL